MPKKSKCKKISTCNFCSNTFEYFTWKSCGKYCSKECYMQHLGRSMKGDNNLAKNPEVRKKISKAKTGMKRPDCKDTSHLHTTEVRQRQLNRLRSLEVRLKISNFHKGRIHDYVNGMTGRTAYDIWVEKHGVEYAEKRQAEVNLKRSITSADRRKKDIESKSSGQMFPNYNPAAIKLIEKYGSEHGFTFQHAENGGEVRLGGYWVDGYDVLQNTIIEVDEPHHFDKEGRYRDYDVKREQRLKILTEGATIIRLQVSSNGTLLNIEKR